MDKIQHLIGSDAFSDLLSKNLTTLQHIVNSEDKFLHNVTRLPVDLIHNLKLTAAEELIKHKFQPADQIVPWKRISTGCQNIDNILKGGIPVSGIVEIYGCSGVGKTQFCLQLALQIQLQYQLEEEQKDVIFISTEDVFPTKRLNQLARAFNEKYNANINFEDHIYLDHIADIVHLKNCLINRVPNFLESKNVGLIVIDSVAGLFRSENENCNYASRSQEFNLISKVLNNLQDQYQLAILVVNQVTDNIEMGISEPCLGLSWANNVTCRFCMSRNNISSIRKFEVIFAPDLPTSSTYVIIKEDGISNV